MLALLGVCRLLLVDLTAVNVHNLRSTIILAESGLKKGGVDQATAQKILKVWEDTGAKSPDQLRRLLLGRSARTAVGVLLQTALDAGADRDAEVLGLFTASCVCVFWGSLSWPQHFAPAKAHT